MQRGVRLHLNSVTAGPWAGSTELWGQMPIKTGRLKSVSGPE